MKVKDIIIKPIIAKDANYFIMRHHYSGKIVPNSQLHLGVFLKNTLQGVMQFGPPMMKKNILTLVNGTRWNGMLELNRMAFSDVLPRNSESRALSVAFRLIKKNYPFIEWILSFSDATQCGDGAIYRASGFVLTQIKKNTSLIRLSDGSVGAYMTYTKGKHILQNNGAASIKDAKRLEGYQMRYIYFLYKDVIKRLTAPIIPFGKIYELNAGMYKGRLISRSKQAMEPPSSQRQCNADQTAPRQQEDFTGHVAVLEILNG